ncbi:MAG TPA: dimethylsulfonioproprionate lyase family protein [Dongiaceae bacterium]|nr:dimethylsulfonioproprionate lyase family protein [Dongiaceae bacterium]
MSRSGPAQALLDAVIAFYGAAGRAGDAGARAMLDAVRAGLLRAAPARPDARTVEASALLPAALGASPVSHVASAIADAIPLFHWRQNPNYNAATMGAAFMAGYGYVEFAGPKEALFHVPDVRVGLLLLGPALHYPLHAHPAEEIYHPLTQGGLWRRGEEAWRMVPAGNAIHHAPMVPHETKVADRTLLALYCWRGDTTTEAVLTA